MSGMALGTYLGTSAAVPVNTTSFVIPPNTITDANTMWQVLNTYASDLSITWTDGTLDPTDTSHTRLAWYGIDANTLYAGNANGNGTRMGISPPVYYKNPSYAGYSSSSGYPEFKVTNGYRALFCHDEPNLWPMAIKVRFKLSDPDAPKEFDLGNGNGMFYEVICPVGQ